MLVLERVFLLSILLWLGLGWRIVLVGTHEAEPFGGKMYVCGAMKQHFRLLVYFWIGIAISYCCLV